MDLNFQIAPASEAELLKIFEAAKVALANRDYQRNIELMEIAGRMLPSEANIFLGLGGAYAKQYEYESAKINFEKAVEKADDKGQTLASAGARCLQFGHPEMATEYFQRAKEQRISPLAYFGLAAIYESEQRFEDVAELIEQALQWDAGFAPALLTRARLERRAGSLAKAQSTLMSVLERQECKLMFRVEAWCKIGEILDALGDYDAAMAAFEKGKGLMRPPERVIALQRKLRDRGAAMEADIGGDDLRRWLDSKESLKPLHPIAVVGGQMLWSGTTPLEETFDSHPGICFVDDSRVFLDDVFLPTRRLTPQYSTHGEFLKKVAPDVVRTMREIYFRRNESFLKRKIEGRVVVEKNHIFNSLLPVMIRMFPEAKYLMMIRDPRDACLNCFMQFAPLNPCSSAFLNLHSTVDEYIAATNLWRTFMARLGNPQMDVRQEEMAGDFGAVQARALRFVGADENAGLIPASQSKARAIREARINSPVFEQPGHWRNYQKYLEPYLEKLEPLVKAFGYA